MASLGLMFLCSIVRKRVGGRARFGIRVGKSYSVVGVGMAGGGMAAARSAPHRAQQRRHNVAGGGGADRDGICRGEEKHGEPPPNKVAATSAVLLVVALVAIVGLAKVLTPTVEHAIAEAGAPKSVVGIVIAALVLLPEGLAAFRSSRANRLQTSMNLALGSALASIGLTIPAVAVVSLLLHTPLTLGLGPKEVVLLLVTLILSQSTLGTGRTTVLQGIVHLVVFAAFLFLSVVP